MFSVEETQIVMEPRRLFTCCVLAALALPLLTVSLPCHIPDQWHPVCGSDGRTYNNSEHLACEVGAQGVTVIFSGACDDPCWRAVTEPGDQEKICGSDGKTYFSEGALHCLQQRPLTQPVTVASSGPCPEAPEHNPCIMVVATPPHPVCGSNGITYRNIWDMKCDAYRHRTEITVENEGECRIECPFSPEFVPVCSSTGATFPNRESWECHLKLFPLDNGTTISDGRCPNDPENSPCLITRHMPFRPVCTSDGVTYPNHLAAKCLRQRRSDLAILHDGTCSMEEAKKMAGGRERLCTAAELLPLWDPICGSDGLVYHNVYHFSCASEGKNTTVVPCPGTPTDICSEEAEREPDNPETTNLLDGEGPACGSDGVTYLNQRQFLCKKKDDPLVTVIHPGPCHIEDDPCRFTHSDSVLVCATNDVTYVSPPAFWCAIKKDPSIKKLHYGECMAKSEAAAEVTP